MPSIAVNLSAHSYSIQIETGLLARLGDEAAARIPGRKVMLTIDAKIADSHGKVATASLATSGFDLAVHAVTSEEAQKSLDTVRKLYTEMLAHSLDRGSCVVAMGGGIVGDLAGFAAATYMRGISVLHLPTTLLAMVDASIGGKTGVNFPLPDGSLGKNLIGAFWQPSAVFCDPLVLKTLDPRHFRCGLAECIKHGMIADASLLQFIREHLTGILACDPAPLTELITRSARIKAEIVEKDERETGLRMLLNLGHTFGHAIESQHHLGLEHGEAVGLGLIAAMQCATATGRMSGGEQQEVTALIQACGLPTTLPSNASISNLLHAMRFDKKSRDGVLQLILPVNIGQVEIVNDIAHDVVTNAWRVIGAQ